MFQDPKDLKEWIGRTETREDTITAWPVRALAATLDQRVAPEVGDALPPLWHWLYFLPADRQSDLADDGHVHRGGFLPPIDLPRRMWAGSRFEFIAPVRVGERVVRESRIAGIQEKVGRSGPLVFVVVRHEIHGPGGLAIVEEHDIVYRGHSRPDSPAPEPVLEESRPTWSREMTPDDVLLFRYSALTFNGHRIHYDRRYCVEQEHYPGLVVHGPLIATLLLDLVRREAPELEIAKFEFRAVAPLFDGEPMRVCGSREGSAIQLWAVNRQNHLAMKSVAEIRP